MARYPNPPEPGRQPRNDVLAAFPTCPGRYICSWVYSLKDAAHKLKYINKACQLHGALPVAQPAEAFL